MKNRDGVTASDSLEFAAKSTDTLCFSKIISNGDHNAFTIRRIKIKQHSEAKIHEIVKLVPEYLDFQVVAI